METCPYRSCPQGPSKVNFGSGQGDSRHVLRSQYLSKSNDYTLGLVKPGPECLSRKNSGLSSISNYMRICKTLRSQFCKCIIKSIAIKLNLLTGVTHLSSICAYTARTADWKGCFRCSSSMKPVFKDTAVGYEEPRCTCYLCLCCNERLFRRLIDCLRYNGIF